MSQYCYRVASGSEVPVRPIHFVFLTCLNDYFVVITGLLIGLIIKYALTSVKTPERPLLQEMVCPPNTSTSACIPDIIKLHVMETENNTDSFYQYSFQSEINNGTYYVPEPELETKVALLFINHVAFSIL